MDKSVATVFEKHPLLAFSPLSHIQVTALVSLGGEIEGLIRDSVADDSTVDAETLNRAYALLWLWVLGAYEVLRTMSQARERFASDLADRMTQEKRYMARLRMPLSKQEYAGNKGPSGLAGLLSGVDTEAKDAIFTVQDEKFSAKDLIARFNALISGIRLSDIRPLNTEESARGS